MPPLDLDTHDIDDTAQMHMQYKGVAVTRDPRVAAIHRSRAQSRPARDSMQPLRLEDLEVQTLQGRGETHRGTEHAISRFDMLRHFHPR